MVRSIFKGLFFLIVSGFCAFGAIFLAGMSGSVQLNLNGKELSISIFAAVIVLIGIVFFILIVFAFFNVTIAVIRFLSGDETALSRYFIKSRQIKGNQALSNALIAFNEGDSAEALLHSGRAKYLLKNNMLSLLINAQIAQQLGNSKLVIENFKKLLRNKNTRSIALSGIVSEKIKTGDYQSALILSKKSVELKPKNIRNINTLFNLQLQESDWVGARQTLQSKRKIEKMHRTTFLRHEAILMVAEAKEKRSKGFTKEALGVALAAVRQYPSFVAGLSFLTELELALGNKKRVEKLLQKCWRLFPHPDIAKSFIALVDNETPEDRRTRFQVLTKMKEKGSQTKILEVELCLAAKDFSSAKKLISKLVKDDPDNYTLTLMAAAEKGSGASDSVVQKWLTKAVYAPKSFTWICKNCGFQTEWVSVCPECDGFDTLEWRRPPFYPSNNKAHSQIPLILEADENNGFFSETDQVDSENRHDSDENLSEGLKEELEISTVRQAREIS